jgi:hypothetical protein
MRMKKLIPLLFVFACLPLLSQAQFACEGIDHVDIYLNNNLVATATAFIAPTIKLDTTSSTRPVTFLFHAYTNTEGLRNSTLDVKDEDGELLNHINTPVNNDYEAVFTYVFDRLNLDDPDFTSFDVTINMQCDRDLEVEQICTVRLLGK